MNTGNITNDGSGKRRRHGIPGAVMTMLAITLTGTLLTACGSSGGSSSDVGSSEQLFMYPQQGYVELITLDGPGSSVTGSLSDVYNCGNNQVNAAPSPIPVSGTVSDGGDVVELDLSGIGNFTGFISPGYLNLSTASGGTVQFQQTSTAGLGQAVVQGQPPVYTISGYTCDNLPATYSP